MRELPHNYCYQKWYRCLKNIVTKKEGYDSRQHTRIYRGSARALSSSEQKGAGKNIGRNLSMSPVTIASHLYVYCIGDAKGSSLDDVGVPGNMAPV